MEMLIEKNEAIKKRSEVIVRGVRIAMNSIGERMKEVSKIERMEKKHLQPYV